MLMAWGPWEFEASGLGLGASRALGILGILGEFGSNGDPTVASI